MRRASPAPRLDTIKHKPRPSPPKRMEWGPIPANENGKGGNPPKGDNPSAIFATYHE